MGGLETAGLWFPAICVWCIAVAVTLMRPLRVIRQSALSGTDCFPNALAPICPSRYARVARTPATAAGTVGRGERGSLGCCAQHYPGRFPKVGIAHGRPMVTSCDSALMHVCGTDLDSYHLDTRGPAFRLNCGPASLGLAEKGQY